VSFRLAPNESPYLAPRRQNLTMSALIIKVLIGVAIGLAIILVFVLFAHPTTPV
jgi:hypothetical protein